MLICKILFNTGIKLLKGSEACESVLRAQKGSMTLNYAQANALRCMYRCLSKQIQREKGRTDESRPRQTFLSSHRFPSPQVVMTVAWFPVESRQPFHSYSLLLVVKSQHVSIVLLLLHLNVFYLQQQVIVKCGIFHLMAYWQHASKTKLLMRIHVSPHVFDF